MERLRRPMKACLSITRRYLSEENLPGSSNRPGLDHLFEGIARPRPASVSPSSKSSPQSSNHPANRAEVTWGNLTETLSKATHGVYPKAAERSRACRDVLGPLVPCYQRKLYLSLCACDDNTSRESSSEGTATYGTVREAYRQETKVEERTPQTKICRYGEQSLPMFFVRLSKFPDIPDKSEGQGRACYTRTWRMTGSLSRISLSVTTSVQVRLRRPNTMHHLCT